VTPDKARQKRLLRGSLILLICGVLYYCFVKMTGFGIPCLFRWITGFKCPGCGISTMIMALAAGDFRAAFEANCFLLLSSPFLLVEIAYSFYLAWVGKKQPKWNDGILIAYAVLLILFGVIRNLPNSPIM